MPESIFVDAGYIIGLLNPRDQHHGVAEELADAVDDNDFVTSEMVLTEVLNGLSDKGKELRNLAVNVVREFKSSDNDVVVVPQTSDQFEQALDLYANRNDQEWGLTDCASCLIMQEMEITDALTHDHHFVQMGFNALMRND